MLKLLSAHMFFILFLSLALCNFNVCIFCWDINWITKKVVVKCYELFCGMVERWNAFSLISSQEHCQRSPPLQVSDKVWTGFESVKNFSSGLVERSYAVAITTKPQQLIDNSLFILGEYVFEKELWHTSKIILQI